jgi:hypothetical protein
MISQQSESIIIDNELWKQNKIVENDIELKDLQKRHTVFKNMDGVLKVDGNKWCAIVGQMPENYVVGFGDTAEEAMYNWWNNWCTEKAV